MRQLLICKGASTKYGRTVSSDSEAAVTVATLNTLYDGAIVLFSGNTIYQASPTTNFSIALGQANSVPFIIPEIDVNTLTITKALPKVGATFKRVFTFPTPVAGKEYGIMFVKKEVVPHERNTFYASIVAGSTTASTEATALVNYINDKYGDKFTASNSGATVTIVADTEGEQWDAKMTDSLSGTSFTSGASNYIDAVKPIGDKAYVEALARDCAGGKGFNYTYADGESIYPGYPEAVESFTLNTSGASGTSTAGYAIFTLRFATGRDSAKQRDERVWQVVHIAVPVSSDSSTTAYYHLNNYLPEGKYTDNIINAATTTALAGKANASNG